MTENSERAALAEAALAAWRDLPEDERNGERPFIMGFNDGWKEAIEAAASVVDQCNREGPYNAIGAASRIRSLAKDR